jgi:hypothetical protein
MSDPKTANPRFEEGSLAFKRGRGLADNPYGFHNGRDVWNAGWTAARDEAVKEFNLER